MTRGKSPRAWRAVAWNSKHDRSTADRIPWWQRDHGCGGGLLALIWRIRLRYERFGVRDGIVKERARRIRRERRELERAAQRAARAQRWKRTEAKQKADAARRKAERAMLRASKAERRAEEAERRAEERRAAFEALVEAHRARLDEQRRQKDRQRANRNYRRRVEAARSAAWAASRRSPEELAAFKHHARVRGVLDVLRRARENGDDGPGFPA